MSHSFDVLNKKISLLQTRFKPGDTYHHYKDPTKIYQIINVGIFEETEEPCVIYEALYDTPLIWVRKISSWDAPINENNDPRFIKVDLF